MRITLRQRFLDRIQSDVQTRSYRRCVQCQDDVKREPMHRMKFWNWGDSEWKYLCCRCAPSRAHALKHWEKEEKNS